MRRKLNQVILLIAFAACSLWNEVAAQTFTMGKECRTLNGAGLEALKNKNYQEALDVFSKMKVNCKTRDGKEAAAVGLAETFNGLGRYQDALNASSEAIKLSKNKSLSGYFQQSVALSKLGQFEQANTALGAVIRLTEKNRNTRQRASNYALMAALQERQLGDHDSATYYLGKAISLDPANPDFYIQKADMEVDAGRFSKAFELYDQAEHLGRTDLEIYVIRSEARLKMLSQKYHSSNAQELRAKMTVEEKTLLCKDLRTALDKGWHNLNKDMFAALVCQ